jgi:hypothetical protein
MDLSMLLSLSFSVATLVVPSFEIVISVVPGSPCSVTVYLILPSRGVVFSAVHPAELIVLMLLWKISVLEPSGLFLLEIIS